MKLCICFGICLSSKWFHLRLTFFPFPKPWADNSSTNQYSHQLFHGWGMTHTSCHPISKKHILGEGPGETPSALRFLSYLINSFLTDIKQLAKDYQGDALRPPSDVYVRSFLCSFFTLIKLCYTRAPE